MHFLNNSRLLKSYHNATQKQNASNQNHNLIAFHFAQALKSSYDSEKMKVPQQICLLMEVKYIPECSFMIFERT